MSVLTLLLTNKSTPNHAHNDNFLNDTIYLYYIGSQIIVIIINIICIITINDIVFRKSIPFTTILILSRIYTYIIIVWKKYSYTILIHLTK